MLAPTKLQGKKHSEGTLLRIEFQKVTGIDRLKNECSIEGGEDFIKNLYPQENLCLGCKYELTKVGFPKP